MSRTEWGDPDDLLERAEASEAILELSSDLAVGLGGSVFVVAGPGLGKTTLLRRAESSARNQCLEVGDRCVMGRSDGVLFGTAHPFRYTDQAFASLGTDALLGTTNIYREAANQNRYMAAVAALDLCSTRSPLVLALDDLHWADTESLALLEFLGRHLRSRRVAMVGALRPWPGVALEMVRRLEEDGCAVVVELDPLSEEASLELLSAKAWGDFEPASLKDLVRPCAGNPLLLEEVARSFLGGSKEGSVEPFSTGRRAILLRRFAGVSDETFRFLRSASVFGSRFRPGVVARILDLDGTLTDAVLEEACGAGLTVVDSGEASFVHRILARTLYEGLQEPFRGELHEAAFEALKELGGEPVELAEQAISAGLVGEDATAAMARAGAGAWEAGDWDAVVRFLGNVVGRAGTLSDPRLVRQLGDGLVGSGRPQEAVGILEDAASNPEVQGVERAKLLVTLGRAIATSDRDRKEGSPVCYFEEAAGIFERLGHPHAAETYLRAASVARYYEGPQRILELAEHARRLSANVDDTVRLKIDAAWGSGALATGRIEGFEVLERAFETVQSNASEFEEFGKSEWWPLSWCMSGASVTEHFDVARRAFDLGFEAAERRGWPAPMGGYLVNAVDMFVRVGDLDRAEEELRRLSKLAESAPILWPATSLLMSRVDLLRGRYGASEIGCRSFDSIQEDRGPPTPWETLWTLTIKARLEVTAGRITHACEIVDRAARLADRTGFKEPCTAPWFIVGIHAYGEAKQYAALERMIAALSDTTSRLPCHWPAAGVLAGQALLEEAGGDLDGACELFERATQELDTAVMPLAYSDMLVQRGAFLRRSGDMTGARAVLSKAHRIAERCGSGQIEQMARTELRLAGGRLRHKQTAWHGLTPRQTEVARLASGGRSNYEIANELSIKRRTVEHHLEAVYAAWGISSRRELMRKVLSGEIDFDVTPEGD
jgi:DNA-binding CsgD family transcriptional regulator